MNAELPEKGMPTGPGHNDVIGTGIQGDLHGILNVPGTQFESHRDPAAHLAATVGEFFKVLVAARSGERGGRNGWCAFRYAPDPGNPARVPVTRQVTAGAGFRPLAALEMKGLHAAQQFLPVTQLGACQRVKTA